MSKRINFEKIRGVPPGPEYHAKPKGTPWVPYALRVRQVPPLRTPHLQVINGKVRYVETA